MNFYVDMEKNFINKKCLSTNKVVKDFLPKILQDIEKKYLNNPNLIIEYWPKIIGKKLAPMTKVLSFENNILYVSVKSSTLYSILTLHEKGKILKLLQAKFSEEIIKNIIFKIG
jgi:hypothetical protein